MVRFNQDLVVCGVLGKGLEVLEAGVHGPGLGVLGGVKGAGGFVGLPGVAGEVVPDAVEVDALAAGDEAVLVRALEREVPEAMVLDDVVPRGNAGDGSVHDDEALDLVGIEGGVGVRDHDADIVLADAGAVVTEGGDDGADVGGLGFLVVAGGGERGAADAAEVGDDDRVVLDEFGGERAPGVWFRHSRE